MRPKAKWAIDSEGITADSEAITAERNDCFSKIQIVRQKNIERKLLSLVKALDKTRFSRNCFGFQSGRFSLPSGL